MDQMTLATLQRKNRPSATRTVILNNSTPNIYCDNEHVQNSVACDLEWRYYTGDYEDDKTELTAVAFSDHVGRRQVRMLEHFKKDSEDREAQLIKFAHKVLKQYRCVFTYNGLGIRKWNKRKGKMDGIDSDFRYLYRRSVYYGLEDECPIEVTEYSEVCQSSKKS